MLPRRDSQDDEEDDFTRVPVQTFTYNQDEPVNKQTVTQSLSAVKGDGHTNDRPIDMEETRVSNKTTAATLDMEETKVSNKTVAAPIDMDMTRASNKTVAAPIDMDMTRASNKTVAAPMDMEMTRASIKTVTTPFDIEETRVSNKTVAATFDMEMTRANNKTVSVASKDVEDPKSNDNNFKQDLKTSALQNAIEAAQSSHGFSPEPTMVVGGMMHQGLNNMHTEDITNFMPVGESTRAINFHVPNPVPKTAGIFDDGDEITNFIPGGESTRAIPKLPGPNNFDFGDDVTSFVPGGESTRAVPRLPAVQNFDLGDVTSFIPGGESTRAVPRLAVARSFDVGDDVTSFIPKGTSTQMIDFRIPPPQAAKINEMPKSPDFGDITSFAPRIESTRAINFPIPISGKNDIGDINELNLSPIGKGIQEIESVEINVPQADIENESKNCEEKEKEVIAQEDDEVTFKQEEQQPMKNISEHANEPSLQKIAPEELDDTLEKNDDNNDPTIYINEQENKKENESNEIIEIADEKIEIEENKEDQVRDINERDNKDENIASPEEINDHAVDDAIESKVPENNKIGNKQNGENMETNDKTDNVNSLKRPSDVNNIADQESPVKIQKTENLKEDDCTDHKEIEKPKQDVVKARKSTKVRKSELPREIRKSMLFTEEMDIFQDLKCWLDQTVSF